MTELDKDSAATHAVELLKHYGFDLGGYTAEALVHHWSRDYPVNWLRSAVIEALYQGRYKAVSVEQILTLWRRRGHPIHHFNHEFERIICSQFPSYRGLLTALPDPLRATVSPTSDAKPSVLEEPTAPTGDADPEASVPELPAESPASVSPASSRGSQDTAPRLPILGAIAESTVSDEQPTIESLPEVRQGELPIQTFKPKASLEPVGVDRRASWSRTDAAKHPIHQFIPTEESSEFYSKLKAVVQHHESTGATSTNLALTGDGQTRQPGRSPES
ncbi:hypothetical protein H6G89_24500 [Oscillatoria sp. FACHB-1407]|uniref:hypothetical protein n=1 Tax=Oscillatoria sp. FACHB-1407 TaxID=2692847 RepID=UPI001689DA0D|nr:hypothetical protein [Oscillatoria sp. FACHB-1407]MBD2464167.1 hypothetical protein [Oscillatoria sp. FACHB-1407]